MSYTEVNPICRIPDFLMLRRDLPRFSLWAFFSHYRRLRWIEWSFFGLCSCTCSTEWRCSLSLSLSVRVIFHNFVVLDCGFYSVCMSVCLSARPCVRVQPYSKSSTLISITFGLRYCLFLAKSFRLLYTSGKWFQPSRGKTSFWLKILYGVMFQRRYQI